MEERVTRRPSTHRSANVIKQLFKWRLENIAVIQTLTEPTRCKKCHGWKERTEFDVRFVNGEACRYTACRVCRKAQDEAKLLAESGPPSAETSLT